MVFVLIFIATALAFPLSVEIYLHGNDNIITRSGIDIRNSHYLGRFSEKVAGITNTYVNFAANTAMLVVGLFVSLYLLKIVSYSLGEIYAHITTSF